MNMTNFKVDTVTGVYYRETNEIKKVDDFFNKDKYHWRYTTLIFGIVLALVGYINTTTNLFVINAKSKSLPIFKDGGLIMLLIGASIIIAASVFFPSLFHYLEKRDELKSQEQRDYNKILLEMEYRKNKENK